MKIESFDSKNWLSLGLVASSGYPSFELEAFINIGTGVFKAKNSGLHFSNIDEFVEAFNDFISTRESIPILKGSYNSYIKLEARRDNAVFICFSIGDAFSGYSEVANYSLKGEFEINSEYLNQTYSELRQLAKDA